MWLRRRDAIVVASAPAKLNLFLEVLARRSDGFHDIETLITAINIFDRLEFEPLATSEIELACCWAPGLEARRIASPVDGASTWSALPPARDNLVCRALERMRERAGEQRGARIRLIKTIPAEAGLGGASSDAAAALGAANLAWGLGWSTRQLAQVGAEVGSDIPFFLTGGASLCRGRGERISRTPGCELHLVVIKPPEGLSTARVYERCQPGRPAESVEPLTAALASGRVERVAPLLFNRLGCAAREMSPWIERLEWELDRTDCLGRLMTGSGTSCSGLYRTARHARRAAERLRMKELGSVQQAATLAPSVN